MHMPAITQFDRAVPAADPCLRMHAGVAGAEPVCGFAADALVETEAGWRAVADLKPGAGIATLDGGFAALAGVLPLTDCRDAGFVHVPGGALGNCSGIILPAQQEILLPAGLAEPVLDAAYALVPAVALVGRFGVTGVEPGGGSRFYTLRFAEEEIVWANSGLMLRVPSGPRSAFCRLSGPGARVLVELLDEGTPFCTAADGLAAA
ncbi:MAG: Hint domain-containing protein [Pseudomonadota bacterium]|jgi:hypothetical protein